MRPAEVLGVEVARYTDDRGFEVFIPRLVGRTAAAAEAKAAPKGTWREADMIEEARAHRTPAEFDLLELLLDHVRRHGVRASFGTGGTPGVGGWYEIDGEDRPVWNYNAGGPETPGYFYLWADKVPADSLERAQPILTTIDGYAPKIEHAAEAGWRARPKIRLDDLLVSAPRTSASLIAAIEAIVEPPAD
jgi:hypothetical protein